MSLVSRKLSNSHGEVDVTVGTATDGGAPAGTNAASGHGAAWAGVVRSGGTAGDGLAVAGQESVRPGREAQAGLDVRGHSLRIHDLFAGDRGRQPERMTFPRVAIPL